MAVKRTIHLWGYDNVPSLISPESIALFWFLNTKLNDETLNDIEIVFSNNVGMSATGKLPILIQDELEVFGFANITNYLIKLNSTDGKNGDEGESLLETALFAFLENKINILVDYQLYLDKKNYDSFTRKQFPKLMYWPMWNYTPSLKRSEVRSNFENVIGYLPHSDDKDYLDEKDDLEDVAADMAQSKTFKIKNKLKQRKREELKAIGYNLQFNNRLVELLKMWDTVRGNLNTEIEITSDLLFWANMYILFNLPTGNNIKTHITKSLGESYIDMLNDKISLVSTKSNYKVTIRDPNFNEQGNIIMTLYNFSKYYI
ncbi:hypothetical protein Kpol_1019p8 [Vanderwaltozyma polyspora DSM 70294]|uniref:Mitochondrial outer membrane transport complex Sam37/metaxin N-terminal domain-containing protein n=1 Tax=Vanderwaltozyma polyspora (strain ATCC 22028 / DSM 70294 / BCRC 21397 / CBS 2163 / NBRC 10782 / NRRL Y-8283 / UCD 57-17) TaxID=436907 RepID=A7TPA1_VANPO|nr:uncharacterized protein Kpol_1019p8 [Vanderwaltozyma polyspora DSM 70294]EDO15888.1 hypothetical protein Kpol_1019p8 [Vanderwaltozyma polyspora DSM 70294]